MIVTVLSENTASSAELGCEHGLSLHLEANGRKILFDTGASGLFAENAKKLGIDLSQVDLAVLSHGHYDHGGGLGEFLRINTKAKVYARQSAFEPHYAHRPGGVIAEIGLDRSLLSSGRFEFCGSRTKIGHDLGLFAVSESAKPAPEGNADLLVLGEGGYEKDDFGHEQSLIIREGGKTLLVAGCAHRGILNILAQCYENWALMPDAVIGGFHLRNQGRKLDEPPERVRAVGEALLDTKARFFTCHCTGKGPYQILKAAMGEHISYLSAGDTLRLWG